MSYALSGPLQAALYAALRDDAALAALVGEAIYDAPPSGTLPGLYVTLGAERVRDASDGEVAGAWHDLTVAVVTDAAGFASAKAVAAAVSERLHEAELGLSRGRLVSLRFRRAEARRESGGIRRIELTFRARVEDA
ncbi:DUF3168 domain-containing protein [Salipiger sp. H15]|uniref:DUF3168 domain-containing protein n=1 Tax=Alloyangia sp. H15 TaxID=3029062 RepID=A0AAU8AEC7_9RHOB